MWRASSPSSGCRPHRATTAASSRCSARSGPNACAPPVRHGILSEDVVTVAGMATAEDRVGMLEMRVKTLETWAGPGQTEAMAEGQRAIRADLANLRADLAKLRVDTAKVQKTQDRHSRLLGRLTSDVDILQGDVAQLKGDVAQLKGDVAELKGDVAELRSDMAEVKGTLQEILRRLPPRTG